MSRLWLPRRFPVGSLAFLAAIAAAPAATAQDPNRDPVAISVLGNDPHARHCGESVNNGEASGQVVDECTRALRYSRLTREAGIQLRIDRGVTYERLRQHDLALADFDSVLATDPHNPDALVNRGAALVQMQRYGDAIVALTDALSFGVKEPYKAYYNRGVAREALHDLQGAYDDYSTALQIRPNWVPANDEVARFIQGRREHLADVLNRPAQP